MRRKRRPMLRAPAKAVIAVAILGLTATLTTACGSSASTGAGGSGTSGTLTVEFTASDEPGFAKVIAAFEKKYPSITVHASYVPFTTYGSILASQLTGGQGPDVFYTQLGTDTPATAGALGSAGKLLNLNGSPWISEISPTVKKYVTFGGKTTTWVDGMGVGFMMYNTDEFRQLRLKAPTTFSQLLGLCQRIDQSHKVPIAIGGAVGFDNTALLSQFLASNVDAGDPNFASQLASGKATFSSTPGWKTSLDEFTEMVGHGCFDPGAAGMQRPDALNEFASGKAVMLAGQSLEVGGFEALHPSFHWSVFAAPAASAQDTYVDTLPNPGVSINAATHHGAAAKKFFDFLATPAESAAFAATVGDVSVQQAAKGQLPGYMAALKPDFHQTDGRTHTAVTEALFWPSASSSTTLSEDLTGLFTKQKTTSAILADMDQTLHH